MCNRNSIIIKQYTFLIGQVLFSFRAYRPQCESSGNYNYMYKQCEGDLCWCTNAEKQGEPILGTLTLAASLKCSQSGYVPGESGSPLTCPPPVRGYPQICNRQICLDLLRKCGSSSLSDQGLDCIQDGCNNCKATIVDKFGNEFHFCESETGTCFAIDNVPLKSVSDWCKYYHSDRDMQVWYYNGAGWSCNLVLLSDLCSKAGESSRIFVFSSKIACLSHCTAHLCDQPKQNSKFCSNQCANAKCSHYPEALCIPDVCTCEPEFYDPVTLERIDCKKSMLCLI